MANVTAAEVRYRLQTLTSADVSDALLDSAAFLPASDVWLSKYVTFASLSANDQALAKAAQIAWVAARCVTSAPVRGTVAGPVEIKPISAREKKEIYDILKAEWEEMLSLLDVDMSYFTCVSSGDDSDNDYDADFEYRYGVSVE